MSNDTCLNISKFIYGFIVGFIVGMFYIISSFTFNNNKIFTENTNNFNPHKELIDLGYISTNATAGIVHLETFEEK